MTTKLYRVQLTAIFKLDDKTVQYYNNTSYDLLESLIEAAEDKDEDAIFLQLQEIIEADLTPDEQDLKVHDWSVPDNDNDDE